MSTINIAGLTPVEDPSYRYKMPKVVGKVEGRGNGIKTMLCNVNEVAQSLNRDPAEVTKFFGCELGSQTSFTDRAIVNGAHLDSDLQNHLSKYIEKFVLCTNCHLPETHYKIKDGMISQKCLACGSKASVDMTHKLTVRTRTHYTWYTRGQFLHSPWFVLT
jgi:translation initiation factor 5